MENMQNKPITYDELYAKVTKFIKKEDELAVGNLVGSCIFNSFCILGIGAIITPLVFSRAKLIFAAISSRHCSIEILFR